MLCLNPPRVTLGLGEAKSGTCNACQDGPFGCADSGYGTTAWSRYALGVLKKIRAKLEGRLTSESSTKMSVEEQVSVYESPGSVTVASSSYRHFANRWKR